MTESIIQNLKPGDEFSFSTRKNAKRYMVNNREGMHPPVSKESAGDQWMIICSDCTQLFHPEGTKVFIHQNNAQCG